MDKPIRVVEYQQRPIRQARFAHAVRLNGHVQKLVQPLVFSRHETRSEIICLAFSDFHIRTDREQSAEFHVPHVGAAHFDFIYSRSYEVVVCAVTAIVSGNVQSQRVNHAGRDVGSVQVEIVVNITKFTRCIRSDAGKVCSIPVFRKRSIATRFCTRCLSQYICRRCMVALPDRHPRPIVFGRKEKIVFLGSRGIPVSYRSEKRVLRSIGESGVGRRIKIVHGSILQ
ncbi:hypothetical protein [Thalassococcus arenae]|uniref:hypothetical protein n=1 Tax=Thalassococcus arenae TaxID=2851652 RepID=UPI0020CB4B2C|nr:hypothetical protein [Thalassococcus arenae]